MTPHLTTREQEELEIELALVDAEIKARNRRAARADLYSFVQQAWKLVAPSALDDGWYVKAICDHLQSLIPRTRKQIKAWEKKAKACREGTHPTRHLMINVPPRFAKSTIVAVLFPAFVWIKRPQHQFLCLSFDKDNALRDAVAARRLMSSDWFRSLLEPDEQWEFRGDQNNKSYYENSKGGHRISGTIAANVTGKNADTVIIDDAHDTRDSPHEIMTTVASWDTAIENRVNDRRWGSWVVSGQRVAPNDLSGHLKAQEPELWDHLNLPFWYVVPKDNEGLQLDKPQTRLGFVDPRNVPGENLLPGRYGEPEQDAIRRKGSHHVETQYQQNPLVVAGDVFKRGDFMLYTRATMPRKFDTFLLSADLSFKGTPIQQLEAINFGRSFVVFDLWGFVGANAYLLEQSRGQWDFERSKLMFVQYRDHWQQMAVPHVLKSLIEAKANGPALVSMLNKSVPMLVEVEPEGSKIDRAYACQGFVEAHNVWLPADAVWLKEWLDEVSGFPNAPHNDRVDTLTQVMLYKYGKLDHLERFRRLTGKRA